MSVCVCVSYTQMHACAHGTPLPWSCPQKIFYPCFVCQLSVPKVIFRSLLVILFGDGSLVFEADFLGSVLGKSD